MSQEEAAGMICLEFCKASYITTQDIVITKLEKSDTDKNH